MISRPHGRNHKLNHDRSLDNFRRAHSLRRFFVGKKLYVGNLSYSTTDQSLQAAFAQYGNVESARVIMDRETGRSKGFGFVEMASDDDAQKAVSAMDGQDLDGRNLKVAEAKPMETGGGRGGPRGGGREGGGFGGPRGPRGGGAARGGW
ncbi:MAG: RNA-binding protein [Bdellovibrionaceae bacterium]|nr:RNA-binding protein [Pseudobdellovibrionaceae bacterium]